MFFKCSFQWSFWMISGIIRRKIFWSFVIFSSIVYGVFVFLEYDEKFWNPAHPNYFLDGGKFSDVGFTVDTETCQIPDLNPTDESLVAHLKESAPPDDCKLNRRWSYVLGENLILNLTAIRSEGYSVANLHCCYKTISRVEQSINNYDDNADAVINVSNECKALAKEINAIEEEFIRVICTSKIWPFHQDVVYRNYHALAQSSFRKTTAQKIAFWKEKKTDGAGKKPPNILIIGLDSMSKLNFQRTMRKTREFLMNIGAVEMHGYAKVGENTFPNAVAFLSGMNESSLEKVCYFTPLTAQDNCPYIWKEFNKAQYLTAHLEDSPALNTFNRLKTGFVEQQVDFYIRPLMQSIFGPLHSKDCAGPDTIEEKTFNYIRNIANLSETRGVPYFIFTWLTSLAHSDMGAAKHADVIFKNFLESMNLNDTILFFISDHGFRYGAFRETFYGWFEDKLPNFWVYLPPKLREEHSHWYKELVSNSRKLLSPFDFYHTFLHILSASPTQYPEDIPVINKTAVGYQTYGSSMFGSIPRNRTCADAGIAPHFCPCATPVQIPLNAPEILSAAASALEHINRLLPPQCSPFTLEKVTAGAVMKDSVSRERNYVVAFLVKPGSFLFEATVNCNGTLSTRCKIKGNVLRMNKISTDVSCVNNVELEMLCYCSTQ